MPPKKDAGSSSDDPLRLGGFDPEILSASIAESKSKIKQPSEVEIAKESRLAEKEARLREKHVAQPRQQPTQAPPPPVDQEEVSALLDKIGAYRERFPHLKSRNKCSPKSSSSELEDELHFFELQLGSSKESGSVGSMLLSGSMYGLEFSTRYWNPLGLNLQGLGEVTRANMPEFEPLVDELMIKYGAGMYMSPEYRLVLALGALVVTVHSANTGDATVGAALQKMNSVVNPPRGSSDL